jgi:phenylpropionate dioxygenase-like ring-hydroxylating dioxygenase large terminal subunit
VLDHVEMHECNYNWKTFIEVYLEDYHVGPSTPAWALRHLRRPEVGIRQRLLGADRGRGPRLRQPGSDIYKKLARGAAGLPRRRAARSRRHLADLLPHIMVEWYPHVLTVSTLHPLAGTGR